VAVLQNGVKMTNEGARREPRFCGPRKIFGFKGYSV